MTETLIERHISEDTLVSVEVPDGVIKVSNEWSDGSRCSACITYEDSVLLLVTLREAQDRIRQRFTSDILAIQYLLLGMGQMTTKSLVEDIMMMRYNVQRVTIHELLNGLQESDKTTFERTESGWIWIAPGIAAPDPKDYPEIQLVLKKEEPIGISYQCPLFTCNVCGDVFEAEEGTITYDDDAEIFTCDGCNTRGPEVTSKKEPKHA